ncbi:MAG: alpha/beta fold hydrolase [Bacteroidota bacterium]
MTQKSLNFRFEARYFQEGELNENTRKVFFVLHGHGQQAKYFIKKFHPLFEEGHCVIAPEGLSRYYLEGYTGRVGATWMTKEDRLTDIKNYITYLNRIYSSVVENVDQPDIYIIGFSQGAATASRWVADSQMKFHNLILWAGIFPPDMDFEKAGKKFMGKTFTFVYGTRDPFLSDKKFTEMQSLSDQLSVKPRIIQFDGDHDINKNALIQAVSLS